MGIWYWKPTTTVNMCITLKEVPIQKVFLMYKKKDKFSLKGKGKWKIKTLYMPWNWLEYYFYPKYLKNVYFSDNHISKINELWMNFWNTPLQAKRNTFKGKPWMAFKDALKETLRTRNGDDMVTVEWKFSVDGLKMSFRIWRTPPKKNLKHFKNNWFLSECIHVTENIKKDSPL